MADIHKTDEFIIKPADSDNEIIGLVAGVSAFSERTDSHMWYVYRLLSLLQVNDFIAVDGTRKQLQGELGETFSETNFRSAIDNVKNTLAEISRRVR